MKRIEYDRLSTSELTKFKDQYEKLFKKDLADSFKNNVVLPGLETRWADWKRVHDSKGTITETVKDLQLIFTICLMSMKDFLRLRLTKRL